MNCSTPGSPVHHQLPEIAQTHVHQITDAIQPFHLLSSPSPPAFNISQHQGLFQWVSSLCQVAKVLELQPQHQTVPRSCKNKIKKLFEKDNFCKVWKRVPLRHWWLFLLPKGKRMACWHVVLTIRKIKFLYICFYYSTFMSLLFYTED